MLEIVSAISLWELVKHTGRWIGNLQRARIARKRESVEALRKVILAARRTTIYLRRLRETGRRDHRSETEIALLWTELGFALEDLGIGKLAKRCRIKGIEWAEPDRLDSDYLEKADVGLERMEELAGEILREIDRPAHIK